MTDTAVSASLLTLALTIGCLHTLAGPDHYVPFIAMARAGSWTLRKTLVVTILCGFGHVLSSILLGALGIAFGWTVGGLEWFEGARGQMTGWLLLIFGLLYVTWSLRRLGRTRRHVHEHRHTDGTVHVHEHDHAIDHAHVHAVESDTSAMTPWILFTLFVFGPCEPLIPVLMYPAAVKSLVDTAWITLAFMLSTICTMTAMVSAGYFGLSRIRPGKLGRYAHFCAGAATAACGAAMIIGL